MPIDVLAPLPHRDRVHTTARKTAGKLGKVPSRRAAWPVPCTVNGTRKPGEGHMPELSTITSAALAHLPFTLLVISAVFALLTLAVMPKPHTGSSIIEVIFRSYLFWTLLLLFLKDAAVLGAFGPEIAGFFGTPATPVPQAANASLALSLIA